MTSLQNEQRRLVPLGRAEALQLLSQSALGRVVFTIDALPAIRPVNHLIDGGDVVIRTHLGSAITSMLGSSQTGVVVAYEADDIDPDSHLGWSVVVTGLARPVEDGADVARYEQRLRPWITQHMDQVIRIVPDMVAGYRLVPNGDGG
ncbi:pyridoxamine 5'-phosphate oxidase family protein [Phytoactinopolyspora limicola]|uniref:pyridoxamine 5'-phosphate oxidase family protein n=1 Tax=Phytoactinopolyspora limicola TaxID=2715536 RepID=UPI0014079CE2|nr:pyridoxamine 5'-phosphate oxidase family protein [Phytoactinopolyspora limicola]